MTTKQFRISIMIIILIALLELVVGVFYYYIFFVPKKEMAAIEQNKTLELETKKAEQARLLEESRLREERRMEEIKLEVKEIDLELLRIARWEDAGEEYEAMRAEEEKKRSKESSLIACMKIVVENYHGQWNKLCEERGLPTACSLTDEDSEKINGDYEIGKKQCDDFFKIGDDK